MNEREPSWVDWHNDSVDSGTGRELERPIKDTSGEVTKVMAQEFYMNSSEFVRKSGMFPDSLDYDKAEFIIEFFEYHLSRSCVFRVGVPPILLGTDDPEKNVHVLNIRDLDEFVHLLFEYKKAYSNYALDVYRSGIEQWKYYELMRFPHDIFSDMTDADRACVEAFLKRRLLELSNGALIDQHEVYSGSSEGANIQVLSVNADADMEGFYALQANLEGIEGIYPQREFICEKLPLSTVRYGRTSESELVIYSVQTKNIEGYSQTRAKKKLKLCSKSKEKIDKILADLPEVASHFLDENGKFCPAKFRELSTNDQNLLRRILGVDIFAAENYFNEYGDWEKFERICLEFDQINKDISALTASLRKGLSRSAGSIRQVMANHLGGLLSAIVIMHKSGVRRVRIPKEFEFRKHYRNPDLDVYIKNSKETLLKRLDFEIDGLVLLEEGDEYVLELSDEIRNKREAMKPFWDLIQSIQV